ncbi:glycoside hydrolase family 35 protein [Apiospora saccharicola]|uniref:Glycoside hydrolase family 35 protein n=1 Tax=Apiospora saccharicola TaxID=335842 RepID=A0ABR1W3G5_9PEZI
MHNEAAVFPIAVAFQGLDAVRKDVGKFYIEWFIWPWGDHGEGFTGIHIDKGFFAVPEDAADSFIAVAGMNISHWYYTGNDQRRGGDRYSLEWFIGVPDDNTAQCGDGYPSDQREIMFDIRMDYEAMFGLPGGIAPVVPAGGCRNIGQLLEFRPNAAAPECRLLVNETVAGWPGEPCGVRIDEAVASSIQSQASSVVTAAWSTRHPAPLPTPTSYNLAAVPTAPVGSAFVAVSLITYLTFGL